MSKDIKDQYFRWMLDIVEGTLYQKLLLYLHSVPFLYSLPLDGNRARDGIDLRYTFGKEAGYPHAVVAASLDDTDCSVLEMMLALALRCEDSIMDNPDIGNRTALWFWTMISSLGLDGMTDDRFDVEVVAEAVGRLLHRDYAPNGKGGLFTLKRPPKDLRTVEIWYQAMWYFNEILNR